MQNSDKPKLELIKAKEAIEEMKISKSLEEFEKYWIEFLHNLERTWSKIFDHFRKSPKWNGWQSKYVNLRKNDQLLCYLINARGAEEHTINEITSKESSRIGISHAQGNNLFVNYMHITKNQIFIDSPQKIKIEHFPAKIKLLSVKNRGRVYPVPDEHLGQKINNIDLIVLAQLAVKFYEDLLNDANTFFVK
ncbi:MAG: hypothetical protein WAR79_02350 [Melioribacteraceae bacterium]